MKASVSLAMALALALWAGAGQAAAPNCTLVASPNPVPVTGNVVVALTASCTGPTASVTFRDSYGDVLTDTAAPFEMHIWANPNPGSSSRSVQYEAQACSPAPTLCSSSFVTITQLGPGGGGSPPTAPRCTAVAAPTALGAAGAAVSLTGEGCSSSVGSAQWRDAQGTALATSAIAPYQATGNVGPNSGTTARSLVFTLTVCAPGSSTLCSSSSASVQQAGTPAVTAPVCTAMAQPTSLPAGGGTLTLTGSCTGSAGAVTWRQAGTVLGQGSGQPPTLAITVGANNSAQPRELSFELHACAEASATVCASVWAKVGQAGAPAPTAPVCTAQASPETVAAAGGVVLLTASCSGAAVGSGTWRNADGSVLGVATTAPYQVAVSLAANPDATTRTVYYSLVACAAAASSTCSTALVSVTQPAVVATPPSCVAQANPALLPAGGGTTTLTVSCTAAPVTVTWTDGAGGVLGSVASPPYGVNVAVPSHSGTSSRALLYRWTACQAAACSTATVTVTQAAASPPATACTTPQPVLTRPTACGAGLLGNLLEQQEFVCSAGVWQASATWKVVQGSCQLAASVPPVPAVEYYHAQFDHYFLTAEPREMAALDAGWFVGWARTGQQFLVTPAMASVPATATPVCRFYGNPAYGLDSHFYSASPAECAAVQQKWPEQWQLESSSVFQVVPAVAQQCPAGTLAVVRFYNNRADVNHRYTTSAIAQTAMRQQGWVEEGVVFCAQ